MLILCIRQKQTSKQVLMGMMFMDYTLFMKLILFDNLATGDFIKVLGILDGNFSDEESQNTFSKNRYLYSKTNVTYPFGCNMFTAHCTGRRI
jgi:hypothetical protein